MTIIDDTGAVSKNAARRYPVFGNPDEAALVQSVNEIPMLVAIALDTVAAAGGYPADAEVVRAELLDCLRPRVQVVELHIRGMLERLRRKQNAYERAMKSAESKIAHALGAIAEQGWEDGLNPRGWFVYILWGTDPQRPVYVGSSSNVLARLGSHLGNRERRALIRRVTLLRCGSQRLMLANEMRLIGELRPLLNVVGMSAGVSP